MRWVHTHCAQNGFVEVAFTEKTFVCCRCETPSRTRSRALDKSQSAYTLLQSSVRVCTRSRALVVHLSIPSLFTCSFPCCTGDRSFVCYSRRTRKVKATLTESSLCNHIPVEILPLRPSPPFCGKPLDTFWKENQWKIELVTVI